ncbi:hypothetical protein B0H14DRAFT_3472001 [Mycena olivaceomarginata]|nr:hypothetical protein B0H14DRAFT_3472001 [Mycena olivaceomarginata]
MSWTSRQVIPTGSSLLLGTFSSPKTILHLETKGLFTKNNGSASATTSVITFVQREVVPTKFIEDYAGTTVIAGLSTVGGFWTLLDAAFALIFGASILYFAFAKRPLSPLGLAHIFQHRPLMENWHEDFPAICTEGGKSGSETAGVVAFIRDRLLGVEKEYGVKQSKEDDPAPWV